MNQPQFVIKTEPLRFPNKPEEITVMICQMNIDAVDLSLPGNPDYKRNLKVTTSQINEVIKNAKRLKPDLIIFPELSIPKSKVQQLKDFSSKGKGCVVVAGSHYADTVRGTKKNVSPIFIHGKEFLTEKVIPSYLETNPDKRKKYAHLTVEDGKIIYVFKDSPIGNFSVVICNDFFNEDIRRAISTAKFKNITYNLDFVVVIALQNKSEKYHSNAFMPFIFNNKADGMYILYANCLRKQNVAPADGRCSLFATFDYFFRPAFQRDNSSDFDPACKIIELREDCLYFVAKINLKYKIPQIDHPSTYRCNIEFIEKYTDLNINTNKKRNMATTKQKSSVGYKKYLDSLMKFTGHINFAGLAEDDKSAISPRNLKELFISIKVSTFSDYNSSENDTILPLVEQNTKEKSLLTEKLLLGRQHDQAKQIEKISAIKYEKRNLGEIIKENKRIVLLGDPGCGKTILTQWLANAYALRRSKFATVDLPDVIHLPDIDLMPVLIRCRDFKEDKLDILLKGSLQEILFNSLYIESLTKKEIQEIGKELENRISNGKIIIIIDGLDEIENSNSRTLFCSKFQNLSKEYFNCYFIATSRIKGYNELTSYVGNGFIHLKVDLLDYHDKKSFIEKWCHATLPQYGIKEQIIEYSKSVTLPVVSALTSNPLLLTNICLLKRTRPLLPERKNEVYEESVKLLFNRRPFAERRIDAQIGSSHLAYIAYECAIKELVRSIKQF